MKRIVIRSFVAILALVVLVSCRCQQIVGGVDKFYHTLPIDGVDREFIVDLPKDYDCAIDYPVVVAFHGLNQFNERAWNLWGWKEKGEDEQFITVFPQGLSYTFGPNQTSRTKWDDGELSDPTNPSGLNPATQIIADDVAFVRAMTAIVKLRYSTDPNKFYATGFSNGGGFVWHLAMEADDIFQAFAPCSGILQYTATTPNVYRPVYFSGGDSESFVVDENHGIPLNLDADEITAFMQDIHDVELNALQIHDQYTVLSEDDDQDRMIIEWNQPIDPTQTHFYKLIMWSDTEHVYPSALNSFRNPNLHHLVDEYWEFFSSL
ncbi:hypothetical protein D9O36_10095 [Zobellia amurskyensis]|uniref:Uncharacterized protein n=1 Tax=Zobellia amurskyensis TaxID=248905 RepID=A0A7X2ZTM5_9FLAO|nr:alpha/beta hydrolase-fold protein [Zobellia amurskyensis]MUH36192.1 hypothetical protein [Zobellia amurskyensis]